MASPGSRKTTVKSGTLPDPALAFSLLSGWALLGLGDGELLHHLGPCNWVSMHGIAQAMKGQWKQQESYLSSRPLLVSCACSEES
jgi:hypothetical protein